MKKLIVELSNERLITPSGLALVGGALGKSDLVLIAGHVTEHARRVVLSLGRSNIWRFVFLDLYRLLVA